MFFEVILPKTSGGSKVVLATLFILACLIVSHVGLVFLGMDQSKSVYNKWGKAFAIGLFIEIGVWDFVLMPCLLLAMFKCKASLSKFVSVHISKKYMPKSQ